MTTAKAPSPNTNLRLDERRASTAKHTSLFRSCATLYGLTLRQHLHGKRWMALTLLFLLPAGLATIIRTTRSLTPSLFLEFVLSWILVPQGLVPLAALLYASGIVRDEQEDQTITYLLTRPIPKWLLYAIKLFATWTTMVVLVSALTMLTYVAIYAASNIELSQVYVRCLKASAILSLAGIAYCSLFGLIGLLTKRILVVGILYIAIVEGMLASFPLSLRMATIIYYTRLMAYRTLDFMVTWPRGNSSDVAAVAWNLDVANDPKLAEHPQLSGCILTLVIASVVCTALAGWLCSQREFHVKTPEME